MKLASLQHGRDGVLVVVSRDLRRMLPASGIAPTLQAALDRWDECAPGLAELADRLEPWTGEGEAFDASLCAAPLPRAYQWADGSAYVNHVALVRRARGAELPESFWSDPLMYQGGSDSFLGPREPIRMDTTDWGIDFEGEVAVVTSDVPQGADVSTAGRAIRLVMLVNDVSLRELIPGELAKGFGFFQSKPSSAFSPVAVTLDELGAAWDGRRLHGTLEVSRNGALFGRADPGVDMSFDFATLIAHAARTRPLGAGTIIGSGTVSNRAADDAARTRPLGAGTIIGSGTVSNRAADGGPGRPVTEGGLGYSCIAEQRTVETLNAGKPVTPFLNFGETVRIEMRDPSGQSIFGAIEQHVEKRR